MKREVSVPVVVGILVVALAVVGFIFWRSSVQSYVEEKPSTMTTSEREAKLMSMFGMKPNNQQTGTSPAAQPTPGTSGGR